MTTLALVLFILFEIVVLVAGIYFGQSLAISVAIGLFVVVAGLLFFTSDFFLDRSEHWRDRDGDT